MKLSSLVKTARRLDERWQRSIRPNERRVLVNARTAMNYATLAPIIERLNITVFVVDSQWRRYATPEMNRFLTEKCVLRASFAGTDVYELMPSRS